MDLTVRLLQTDTERDACARLMAGFELVGELRDYLVRGHSEILLRKTRGTWAEFWGPARGTE